PPPSSSPWLSTLSLHDALPILAAGPNSLAWPSDDEITSAFTRDRFYGRFTQERIRLILGAIDVQMRVNNPKTEPAVFDYAQLQIDRKSTRLNSSHVSISYAVFC